MKKYQESRVWKKPRKIDKSRIFQNEAEGAGALSDQAGMKKKKGGRSKIH